MHRLVLIACLLVAACVAAALLRVPVQAAGVSECTSPGCNAAPPAPVQTSLASELTLPRDQDLVAVNSSNGWVVDLRSRTYFAAECTAAKRLEAESSGTLRMRFEQTMIDLGYQRSDQPGC